MNNSEGQKLEKWRLVSSRMVLDEKHCRVRRDEVELPDGRIVDDYFVIERPDIAVVVAIRDDGLIPLVRQYKHGIEDFALEFPAGGIGQDNPEDGARRELLEETGHSAKEMILIGSYFADASKTSSVIYTYLALGATQVGEQTLDENELSSGLEVTYITLPEVKSMLINGAIRSESSVAAGFAALHWLAQ